MRKVLRQFKNVFLHFCKQVEWKKNNLHNHLSIVTNNYITLDVNKIICGKGTYGKIIVDFYGNEDEGLIIGNYCSIAPNTHFLLGGNHLYTNISTFPFDTYVFNNKEFNYSKGKIIIKDDVWIGNGATILSGVTLGQGCIVGAKSVVTKNVPPYAIVAGNPATVIKYRFEENIIKVLLKIDFSKIDLSSRKLLYTTITSDNVAFIVNELSIRR